MSRKRNSSMLSIFSKENSNPSIHVSAQQNDVLSVQRLVKKRRSLNQTDETDRTALHIASFEGHCGMVSMLLGLGSDCNKRDINGWTCLHHACAGNNPQFVDICRVLLKDGKAQPNAINNTGAIALHYFVQKQPPDEVQYVDTIQYMKDTGCDIDSQTKQGETPLFQATVHGNLIAVNALIALGANINKKTVDGETPLHAAIRTNNVPVANALINANADPNINANEGCCRTYCMKFRNQTILRRINDAFGHGSPTASRKIEINTELVEKMEKEGYESPKIMTAIYELHKRGLPTNEELLRDELANGMATNANECKICLDEQINSLLLPCRHCCLCIDCATMSKAKGLCPICREPIVEVIEMFIS